MNLQEMVLKYKETNNNRSLLNNILIILQPFIQKQTARLLKILPLEFDDIKQEVMLVIMKRIKTYDSSKGKFLTYITNTLKGDPTNTLQRLKCKKRGGDGISHYLTLKSLQHIINEEDKITLEETIMDEKDSRSEINYNLLYSLKDNLTDMEQRVFELLYVDSDLGNTAIARILNLKVLNVVQLRKKIRNKCKVAMRIK